MKVNSNNNKNHNLKKKNVTYSKPGSIQCLNGVPYTRLTIYSFISTPIPGYLY